MTAIPNIDHRFGDGRAEILGIAVSSTRWRSNLHSLQPNSTIVVRISVRAKANLDQPIVGFMFRNHLGVDFAGTNTAREGIRSAAAADGEICTVDFYLDLPALYASLFSFSPAIADGTLEHYAICDWIDNALVLPMEHVRRTHLRTIPFSVPRASEHEDRRERRSSGVPAS